MAARHNRAHRNTTQHQYQKERREYSSTYPEHNSTRHGWLACCRRGHYYSRDDSHDGNAETVVEGQGALGALRRPAEAVPQAVKVSLSTPHVGCQPGAEKKKKRKKKRRQLGQGEGAGGCGACRIIYRSLVLYKQPEVRVLRLMAAREDRVQFSFFCFNILKHSQNIEGRGPAGFSEKL